MNLTLPDVLSIRLSNAHFSHQNVGFTDQIARFLPSDTRSWYGRHVVPTPGEGNRNSYDYRSRHSNTHVSDKLNEN